ncbi:hypothetical protein GE300_00505 [Rhodobacteraceae bacterium 2CG4]|uniref:LPS sulfotransferase NodH n=1 Tax=Halovulum marinum TaxID=2662447 RepID=A0A6L5YW50_9RHOB|nr:sulfotransferase [Halovulum marinum]MSU88092.1 hypothetical protein [Halovulum marinum]
MSRDFVLLATPRTGSYNLVSLLDSAPDIVCYTEIYKAKWVELPADVREELGLKPKQAAARDAMGATLLQRLAARHPGQAVGFKLFPMHLQDRPFLEDHLTAPDRPVVILSRAALAICVSLLSARKTERYVQRDADAPRDRVQVTVTPDELRRSRTVTTRFRKLAQSLRQIPGKPVFDIRYEEVDDPGHMARLLDFLGSEATPGQLSSSFYRQTAGRLHERVANWDELVAHLRASDETALLGEAGYRADGTPWT